MIPARIGRGCHRRIDLDASAESPFFRHSSPTAERAVGDLLLVADFRRRSRCPSRFGASMTHLPAQSQISLWPHI